MKTHVVVSSSSPITSNIQHRGAYKHKNSRIIVSRYIIHLTEKLKFIHIKINGMLKEINF